MDKKQTYKFIKKSELGKCPCCTATVFDDQLYVLDKNVYHFSCYNEMKKKENNE